jgi:hypothetical protein
MTWQAEGWDELKEVLEQEECATWDGFDAALIGYTKTINVVAVYDVGKMIDILMTNDEMEYDEALDYLHFNVFGAYIGEKTPMHVVVDYDRVVRKSDA